MYLVHGYGIPHIRTNPSFAPKQRTSRTVTTRAVSWPRGSSSNQSPRSESPWDSWALTISHSEGFDWSCFLVGFWSCCCCGAMSCLPSKAAILLKEIDLLKKCNKFCRSANGYCLFNSFVFQICVHHFYPTRTLYSVCVCLMIALWANRNIIIIIIISSSSIVIINYYYTAIQWISLETSQNQVRLISEAPPRLHPTQASNPGLAMPGPPELGQVTPTWRSTNPQPW